MAVEAVQCEVVSATDVSGNRKKYREFLKFGIPLQFSCFISGRIQWFAAEFPAQLNREFADAYQGLFGIRIVRNRDF